MAFQNVTGKMGNMRKVADWVVYPHNAGDDTNLVKIQCDKRIARVNLTTGKAILSDGKGGHQGNMKLSPMLGAKEVDCPADMLEQLKTMKVHVGPIVLVG